MNLYRVVLAQTDNYYIHGAITAIIISATSSDHALEIANQEFPSLRPFAYAVVDNSSAILSTEV